MLCSGSAILGAVCASEHERDCRPTHPTRMISAHWNYMCEWFRCCKWVAPVSQVTCPGGTSDVCSWSCEPSLKKLTFSGWKSKREVCTVLEFTEGYKCKAAEDIQIITVHRVQSRIHTFNHFHLSPCPSLRWGGQVHEKCSADATWQSVVLEAGASAGFHPVQRAVGTWSCRAIEVFELFISFEIISKIFPTGIHMACPMWKVEVKDMPLQISGCTAPFSSCPLAGEFLDQSVVVSS